MSPLEGVQDVSLQELGAVADVRTSACVDSDQIPFYPYRDDALRIWRAIESWVSERI